MTRCTARNNTQAIDVGSNTLIAARVTDYKPAAVPALDAIKDAVRQKVIAVQSNEAAHKDGVAKLAELEKSKATAGFSSPLKVSRNDAQGVPPAALSAIYKADAQKLPAYVGVDLGDDGYAIYRVNSVVAGAPIDPQRLAAAQQQIAQVDAQSEIEAYVEGIARALEGEVLRFARKQQYAQGKRRLDRRQNLQAARRASRAGPKKAPQLAGLFHLTITSARQTLCMLRIEHCVRCVRC